MHNHSTVIPGLRYANPNAAIDFIKRAFGFVEQGVFRDDNGKVMHAQLVMGGGMIMLGPDDSSDMKEQSSHRSTTWVDQRKPSMWWSAMPTNITASPQRRERQF